MVSLTSRLFQVAYGFVSRGATCVRICLGTGPAIRPAGFYQSQSTGLLWPWLVKYRFGGGNLLGPSSAQSRPGRGNICWRAHLGRSVSTRSQSLRFSGLALFDDLGAGRDPSAGHASTSTHRLPVFWLIAPSPFEKGRATRAGSQCLAIVVTGCTG